jgi:hypothetical protein
VPRSDAPPSYKQRSQTQSTPRRDGDAERIGQHCRPCAARPSGERCPAEVLVGQPRPMGSRIDSVFSVTPLCRCRSVHHAGPPLTAPLVPLPSSAKKIFFRQNPAHIRNFPVKKIFFAASRRRFPAVFRVKFHAAPRGNASREPARNLSRSVHKKNHGIFAWPDGFLFDGARVDSH